MKLNDESADCKWKADNREMQVNSLSLTSISNIYSNVLSDYHAWLSLRSELQSHWCDLYHYGCEQTLPLAVYLPQDLFPGCPNMFVCQEDARCQTMALPGVRKVWAIFFLAQLGQQVVRGDVCTVSHSKLQCALPAIWFTSTLTAITCRAFCDDCISLMRDQIWLPSLFQVLMLMLYLGIQRQHFCLRYIRLPCVLWNLQAKQHFLATFPQHSSSSSILQHLIYVFPLRAKIVFCQFFCHWWLARQHRLLYHLLLLLPGSQLKDLEHVQKILLLNI